MISFPMLILDHPIFGIFHLSFSGDLAARATAAPGPGQPAGVASRKMVRFHGEQDEKPHGKWGLSMIIPWSTGIILPRKF